MDYPLEEITFPAGTLLARQGDPGSLVWLIKTGQLEISKTNGDGLTEPPVTIAAGALVGEMALIDGGLRTANVTCLTQSTLVQLTADDFKIIVGKCKPVARYMLISLIGALRAKQGVPANVATTQEAMGLFQDRASLQVADRRVFPAGHVFFRQGDEGHAGYVIQTGEVAISRDDFVLASVGPGRIFGEMALLLGGTRSATATATAATVCELINKKDLEASLTTMPPVLKALTLSYMSRLKHPAYS